MQNLPRVCSDFLARAMPRKIEASFVCHQPLRVNGLVTYPLGGGGECVSPSLNNTATCLTTKTENQPHRGPFPFSHSPQREVLSISTPNMFGRLSLSSPSNVGHACSCQHIITVFPKYGHGWPLILSSSLLQFHLHQEPFSGHSV